MKKKTSLPILFAAILSLIALTGCHARKGLLFADREWHISDYFGQIIDRDTTYRMTFGEILIPVATPIVSSADSVRKYPGMERFISDILHTARLDSAEILFYAPEMAMMFVRTGNRLPLSRPSSISSPLTPSISLSPSPTNEDRPFTMWIYDNDMEDWNRQPSEMYTYTYFDKKKRQLLIVDFFDYGDEPIAQIFILQSRTKSTAKMGLPEFYLPGFLYHDLRRFEKDVEFWANHVDRHRRLAFANYKIGQEQKSRKK